MKKNYVLCLVVLLAVLFIFSTTGKMQDGSKVKNQVPAVSSQELQSKHTLKPDVNFGKIQLEIMNWEQPWQEPDTGYESRTRQEPIGIGAVRLSIYPYPINWLSECSRGSKS